MRFPRKKTAGRVEELDPEFIPANSSRLKERVDSRNPAGKYQAPHLRLKNQQVFQMVTCENVKTLIKIS